MATYYVNLSEDYGTSQVGTSDSDPFGGAYGLQKALDNVAAGETIYVKGHGYVKHSILVVLGAAKSAWVVSDSVQLNGGGGWSGTIIEKFDDTNFIVKITSDSVPSAAQTIANTTRSDTATISSVGTSNSIRIDVDATDGTTTQPITIQGTNDAWEVGEGASYQATLDGSLCHMCMYVDSGMDYFRVANITFSNATAYNFYTTATPYKYGWIFDHCIFENGGGNGFRNSYTLFGCIFYKCIFRNNAGSNLYTVPTNGYLLGCAVYGSSLKGIEKADTGTTILNSLIFNNEYDGIIIQGAGVNIVNCVIDNNGRHGIHRESTAGYASSVICCRITNNGADYSGYGFYVEAGGSTMHIFQMNVLGGNDSGNDVVGYTPDSTNSIDQSSDQIGYVDQANNIYDLTPQAVMAGYHSTPNILIWDSGENVNICYATAGMGKRHLSGVSKGRLV